MLVKPIVVRNKVDAMLAEMGGKMKTFNQLEAINGEREIKDVVEELDEKMITRMNFGCCVRRWIFGRAKSIEKWKDIMEIIEIFGRKFSVSADCI